MKKNYWCLIKKNTLFLYSILSITLTSYAYDFSAIAPSGHTLYYNIIGNGVEVTNQLGIIVEGSESYLQEPTGDIIIPSSVTHNEIVYPVTAIGDGAFFTCENITSIFIPNSITSIGREAFRGITSLTTIIIPNSVSTIGYHAFCGCRGLNTVVIGNSITSIGQWAFDGCSNLRCVTIPNSATSIGSAAFTGVKVVNYCGSASGSPWGALRVGCFYEEGDFVYQDNTKTTLIAYIGSDSSVAIPNSVSSIGNYAFYCCRSLRCVTIPNSVTSIGIRAFSNCESLSSVTIGSSVTYISSYAFNECSDLTSLTIECTNPPRLGSDVFFNVPTDIPVYVPSGKVSDYQAASGWNNFTNILSYAYDFSAIAPSGHTLYYNIIGNGVEVTNQLGRIVERYESYLQEPTGDIIIPSSVTHNEIVYPVTAIGDGAFFTCENITSIFIPNSITSIGREAFRGITSLTTIIIPNSVSTIGYHAFCGCGGLNTVVIGNSVTSIGKWAFDGCSNLRCVTIPNSATSIGSEAFRGVKVVNYCGSASGSPWGALRVGCFYEEGDFIYQDNTKTTLIAYIGSDSSVAIPNSVSSIGDYAFYCCRSLRCVTIPNSVTSIRYSAFSRCSGLTSVTIPNSVTSIESDAFKGCSGLTSVVIGNSVTRIGTTAFWDCSNLKTVYNLSNLNITNSDYGLNANRVVNCTEHSGFGDNIIYKIPTTFAIVGNDASIYSTNIPRSTIPTNFIYRQSGVWKAKNIVLTDGQDAFEAPETFIAETATYTREFTNSNRSTLYLPFTAAIPENFEVYDFTNFTNNTISFTKREDSIYAYTPYLVGYDLSKDGNTTTCTITKTNAVFPKSESANYHPVTRNGMTFQGVLERTEMTSTNNYGYSNGFFVQSGGHAHVNPFRSYFTYTAPAGAPQSLPPTLNVEVGYGDPLDIDAVETPEQEYDGRYGKDVYDMLGRLVRKNAENLEGLPQGIYIWKGKKHFNN